MDIRRPPKWALQPITAGRLRGKSNINSQWRIDAMNQQYGPCGQGWSWRLTDITFQEIGPETICIARVEVATRDGAPVPGVGSAKIGVVEKKSGLRADDDAVKKATTDALSYALRFYGVAGDVYLGAWDDIKYHDLPMDTPPAWNQASIGKEIAKIQTIPHLTAWWKKHSGEIPEDLRAWAVATCAERKSVLKKKLAELQEAKKHLRELAEEQKEKISQSLYQEAVLLAEKAKNINEINGLFDAIDQETV